jgi:hypothetical protein
LESKQKTKKAAHRNKYVTIGKKWPESKQKRGRKFKQQQQKISKQIHMTGRRKVHL